ncbi:MAG: hypothetical protein A2Y38_24870 [Spirochaetes bacterium GWB1_59_5]|nr:MAG: hypothetical protein A2Y38_24870 [Spirochaetes bacterium GWB1_59_5]
MIQTLEVGKPFPIKNPHGKNDCVIAAVVGQSFDIYCWIDGVNSKEVQAWKRGWLRYGAYVKDDIPFFLLYFVDVKWPLDISINILAEKEKDRPYQEYLHSAANMVNLMLIDADSNTLKAMRMIGLDNAVAGEIRLACINQLQRYQTSDELNMHLDAIVSTIHTEEMIKASEMRELPHDKK